MTGKKTSRFSAREECISHPDFENLPLFAFLQKGIRMSKSAIVFYIALFLAVANASILGIDFGTQFMKIAIVRPGSPFEIVTDLSSKRKTPAAVIFDDSTRTYG